MPDPITDAEMNEVLALAAEAEAAKDELFSGRNLTNHDQERLCRVIQRFESAANSAFVTRLITELLSLRKASHSVSQCCPESERLAKRVEELEAVVARLPKTADGVPITPGMNLWVQCIPEENVFPDGIAMIRAWMDCEEVDARTVDFTECYSTREAAAESLAARGAGR